MPASSRSHARVVTTSPLRRSAAPHGVRNSVQCARRAPDVLHGRNVCASMLAGLISRTISWLAAATLVHLFVLAAPASAQTDGLLQIDDPLSLFLERQYTAGHLHDAFLAHQPLSTYEARAYLDTLALHRTALSTTDRRLLAYFRGDATFGRAGWVNEHVPWLYTDGRDFFAVEGNDYAVQINPLLYLSAGRASTTANGDDDAIPTWQNTRGVRASGRVGDHLFFESRLEENQVRRPLPASGGTAPRLGFTKFHPANGVYDYFRATGIVGWRSETFEIRFGRDRNHWGPGRTSVLLSDYPTVYDQLQIRTTFWRLQYVNLFAAFTDLTRETPGRVNPRRYGAMHHLSLHLPGRVTLGFFESIIFAPDTLGVRGGGFDVSYLNPVIFYRAVEHDRGSPDNALVGFDASWIVYPGIRLYGQYVLDELVVSRIGEASWVNKWGWTAGLHVADVVPGLSAWIEYTRLRPFLYSHRDPSNAYLHHGDLLGHPAGPNAWDVALFLTYRPLPRLRFAADVAYTRRGRNPAGVNVGADPTVSYDTRAGDRAELLAGVRQEQLLVEARAGYEVLPRLFAELALQAEATDDAEYGLTRYVNPSVLLRWGLPFQSVRY